MAGDTGLDFKLTFDSDGILEFSYDKVDDFRNNLILSVEVPLEKYSLNRTFGSKVAKQSGKKNTLSTEEEIKQDIVNSAQWIIDIGRFTNIDIEAEKVNPHRINVDVLGTQANGITVPYSTFVEVI